MTNPFEIGEKKKEQKNTLRKDPLLVRGLGELVLEVIKLSFEDSNVIKPKNEIPDKSLENYERYNLIINEINRREQEYTRKHGLYYDY